jgi:DNA-binding response OmpR family regulator
MGKEILRQEGFQVETAADGVAAAAQLKIFDPLVLVADVQLPLKSGYELANEAKASSNGGLAVLLTVGARAEAPTPAQLAESRCDATIGKPFEATALIETVRRLASAAEASRAARRRPQSAVAGEIDRERVEAAVTLALETALPALIQEITERVLIALKK